MPTARQLEIFLAVEAAGSIRRAADSLKISQPSVSKQLRALERRVGGELLIRARGAKAQLSPLGRTLLEDARQTLAGQRRITRTTNSDDAQQGPRLFIRQFLLESLRKRLPELYQGGLPRSTAFTVVDDAEDVFARLAADPGAFAVVRAVAPPSNPRLRATVLRTESASLYASPKLLEQFGGRGGGLHGIPILVPGQSGALSAWMHRVISRAGIDEPQWRRGSQFPDLLLEEVAGDAGCAIFIDWHVAPAVETARIVPIPDTTVPISVLLVAGPAADEAAHRALFECFSAFLRQ